MELTAADRMWPIADSDSELTKHYHRAFETVYAVSTYLLTYLLTY